MPDAIQTSLVGLPQILPGSKPTAPGTADVCLGLAFDAAMSEASLSAGADLLSQGDAAAPSEERLSDGAAVSVTAGTDEQLLPGAPALVLAADVLALLGVAQRPIPSGLTGAAPTAVATTEDADAEEPPAFATDSDADALAAETAAALALPSVSTPDVKLLVAESATDSAQAVELGANEPNRPVANRAPADAPPLPEEKPEAASLSQAATPAAQVSRFEAELSQVRSLEQEPADPSAQQARGVAKPADQAPPPSQTHVVDAGSSAKDSAPTRNTVVAVKQSAAGDVKTETPPSDRAPSTFEPRVQPLTLESVPASVEAHSQPIGEEKVTGKAQSVTPSAEPQASPKAGQEPLRADAGSVTDATPPPLQAHQSERAASTHKFSPSANAEARPVAGAPQPIVTVEPSVNSLTEQAEPPPNPVAAAKPAGQGVDALAAAPAAEEAVHADAPNSRAAAAYQTPAQNDGLEVYVAESTGSDRQTRTPHAPSETRPMAATRLEASNETSAAVTSSKSAPAMSVLEAADSPTAAEPASGPTPSQEPSAAKAVEVQTDRATQPQLSAMPSRAEAAPDANSELRVAADVKPAPTNGDGRAEVAGAAPKEPNPAAGADTLSSVASPPPKESNPAPQAGEPARTATQNPDMDAVADVKPPAQRGQAAPAGAEAGGREPPDQRTPAEHDEIAALEAETNASIVAAKPVEATADKPEVNRASSKAGDDETSGISEESAHRAPLPSASTSGQNATSSEDTPGSAGQKPPAPETTEANDLFTGAKEAAGLEGFEAELARPAPSPPLRAEQASQRQPPAEVENPDELVAKLIRQTRPLRHEGGEVSLDMRLKPESLGEMRMQAVMQDSVVQLKFGVESESARQAVQNMIPEIRQSLNSAGVQVSSVTVDVNASSNGAGQPSPNGRNGRDANSSRFRSGGRGETASRVEPAQVRKAALAGAATGGLDYYF